MQGAPYRHGVWKRPRVCYIPHTEKVVSFTGMFQHPSRWLQNFTQSRNLLCIQIDAISLRQKTVSQFPFGKGRCIEGIWLCTIFWPGLRSTTYLPIWWQSFTLRWSLFSCKLKNSFSDMTLQVIFRFHLTVTIPWFFRSISTEFSILLEYSIWAPSPPPFLPPKLERFSSWRFLDICLG